MEGASILLIAAAFILLRIMPVIGSGKLPKTNSRHTKGKQRSAAPVKLIDQQHNVLIILSVIFVFYLQPTLPLRGYDFWLPLASLGLTLCCYAAISGEDPQVDWKKNRIDLLRISVTTLLLAATRFISYEGILTASRPPQFIPVLIICAIWAALTWLCYRSAADSLKKLCGAAIILLILILICLKTPFLCEQLSRLARLSTGQSIENASATDLRWLGFSYIAFRLLSTLIDARKGRKFTVSCGEYLCYVCFPPALSAGPIDRLERFDRDWKALASDARDRQNDWISSLERIGAGLFKKFILADSLARFALSSTNYAEFISRGWAWVALFAYALQLYFDFSGYSDIAIGLGKLIGIDLPENFKHPYLKADLAKFWSNWHITLTQWIRSYVFNPLTRELRGGKKAPQWLVILITQMVTMLLIGLWHGITLNYVIWGIWHGLGLFIHQLYGQWAAGSLRRWEKEKPALKKVYTVCSTLLTIIYVSLGWVWFVTPDPSAALEFFGRLFA